MSLSEVYSADELRRRAYRHVRGEIGAVDHVGDHLLNPHALHEFEGRKLRDAAVLVPVIDDGGQANVIFTLRTATLRSHSGQIAFPGGAIDPEDRSAEEAALRETEEEIGLSRSYVETVGRLPDYVSFTGFRITPVIGVVTRGYHLTLNPVEVDEVFEVPLSFLMDPRNHRQDSIVRQGIERHFYQMPYGERNIWGITAGIVRSLYERLYA
ncbi:CoA pyrophosphatase [Rhizobiaceae bacterium n13]|uniref:CoA pyrophosphatase n=1 Tax=Ferirhizobium litorale TaxID=2927786 RepID=A0AAE3QCB2_9HYPH|nr:CoA pyrophosphatase [Fererhizobium litorale]MDI7860857.1 CoA pyrophosphatase [Fererhizobium litorale]MDI7921005.1 CoA pyrophosphatase [Fererhizobium litorale]